VSIVLVTILFGVYRLSGGTVTTAPQPTAQEVPDRRNQLEGLLRNEPAAAPQPPAPSEAAKPAAPKPRPANDILAELTQKVEQKPKADPKDAKPKPGGLGDIEKSLGLR
jgi:hypothetical protein